MREPQLPHIFSLTDLSLVALEHIRRSDVEIHKAVLHTATQISIRLGQIEQAMLEAQIELPLIPHLDTEFVVKTEVKTLHTLAEDIGLDLRAALLDYILTQNSQTEVGAEASDERYIVRKRCAIAQIQRNLQIS